MFQRDLSKIIEKFSHLYPVIGITGPRQSGKTTLARALFGHLPYVSFENLDIRVLAQNDPRSFLKQYHDGAIFDEVQHVPDILSYLQELVDSSNKKGRFVLTGSQNFALGAQISQSFSGRVGMTKLLPLSLAELNFHEPIPDEIFHGGYPKLHDLKMEPIDFYPSYIQTYIERDVRQLKNIENLGKFQTFLKLCAGRVGQVVNLSSLAVDCGISHTTVRQWLTILEASYLIFLLQPYHENFSKRVIKNPKIYFYDTGLVCSLLGIEKSAQLKTHYLAGGLFENLVILELMKTRLNAGLPPNLSFWRDHTGNEIDCIAEWGGLIKAIEVKSSATFQPNYIKSVREFALLTEKYKKQCKGTLIYGGDQSGKYDNIEILPLRDIKNIE